MTIAQIKKAMDSYVDFYGGDLLDRSEIKSAKSKKELESIIEKHRSHMEMQLNDAHSHLDNFKRKIGLSIY